MNQATDTGRAQCSKNDLKRYFERVGYRGPRAMTSEVLQELHIRHVEAIPFEAIDVLLGRPIDLKLDALIAKLVHGARGGYCFEQNLLFRGVLLALGFDVESLIARSRWGRAPERRRLSADGLAHSLAEDFGLGVEAGWADMIAAAVARGDQLGAEA
ncbi:MAG TPA: arylamine N-acetyltransferase [Phenylobacterium sp.]|nr:arylamine N-acetyltransferase [Phenylobacterium sp.]